MTFRGWGSNSIDALSGIHVSLISKSILILTEILTLRGQGVGGSEDNVSLTLSVHFSNFDSPLSKMSQITNSDASILPKFISHVRVNLKYRALKKSLGPVIFFSLTEVAAP